MNEEELARFYEERRGDMSIWSEKPTKAKVRRGGTVVFSLRFDRRELALLRERAEAQGTTLSEFIRRAVVREATAGAPVTVTMLELSPQTGTVRDMYVLDEFNTVRSLPSTVSLTSPRPKSPDTYVLVS